MQITSTRRISGRPGPQQASVFGSAQQQDQPRIPEGEEKEWAVLFYNAGHNDEAKMCTYSLDQLETVGSDENTHLVVMNHRRRWVGDQLLGRFEQYEGTKSYYVTKQESPEQQPGWEKALPLDAQKFSQVMRTGPHKVTSPVIDEHPENPNMGDRETAKKFILENMKRFPAKHYCVVFSGHGAAFQGQMIVHGPEGRISNEELGAIFEDVSEETGKRIDTVNMNTCYSANLESLYPLRNSADAIVASESTVFAGTQPLAESVKDLQQALKEGHDVDGKQLAKLFVERARRQEMGNLFTPTLSALDPSAFGSLSKAIKVLQDTLMEERVEPELLRKCVQESVRFEYSSIPRDIFVTDIGSFAAQVEKQVENKRAKKAARQVRDALGRAVLAEQHAQHSKETLTTKSLRLLLGEEQNIDGVTGLTIYYDTDVNNDSRFHRIEGGEYAAVNQPRQFLEYLSCATEEERRNASWLKSTVREVSEKHSKWKRRTSQKIPIPKAIDMAETAAMGAASHFTFSALDKAGIPAGDVLFGGYFTARGAYDVGKGAVGLYESFSTEASTPELKEKMIEQAAQVGIGACLGTFGLSMLGVVPDAVAWPVTLGALGLRVGKEIAKLAVQEPVLAEHRREAEEYANSKSLAKLS